MTERWSVGGWPRGSEPENGAPPASLLLVRCGPFRLGIPAEMVRGVVEASEVVPLGLLDVEGLVWRDGVLFPVTGLAPLLGLPATEGELRGHGVLVRAAGGSICFVVDEALDLVQVPAGSTRPLPGLVSRAVGLVGLEAVVLLDPPVFVVDPLRLLGPDRAARLARVAARMGAPSAI